MSRTYRNLRPKMRLRTTPDNLPKGKCRDGSPQHYSKSCDNNGGCPYCERNRLHSTNKRKEAFKYYKHFKPENI